MKTIFKMMLSIAGVMAVATMVHASQPAVTDPAQESTELDGAMQTGPVCHNVSCLSDAQCRMICKTPAFCQFHAGGFGSCIIQ